MMRALVVYESMFGNTRDVADAIAHGLESEGVAADLIEVGEAPLHLDAGTDLVVLAAPTHAFGLSRASSRSDAAEKAHRPVISSRIGVREWLDEVDRGPVAAAVAVSTKVVRPRLPGSAAKATSKRLAHLGFRQVLPPEDFWVDGLEGPLLAGELDRARGWGSRLGRAAAGYAALRPHG